MSKQLYVKLEEGERIKEGDVYFDKVHGEWIWITSLETEPIAGPGWIRPVAQERVTGTESAFPSYDGNSAIGGVTIREYFAGLAMQALIPFFRDKSGACEIAVSAADELIAALDKKEGA